jgi:hypothetical protein
VFIPPPPTSYHIRSPSTSVLETRKNYASLISDRAYSLFSLRRNLSGLTKCGHKCWLSVSFVLACAKRPCDNSLNLGLCPSTFIIGSYRWAKDFSSILCVQIGSGVHPASCTVGTGAPFPGGKARPGRDADHSPPSSAEVDNE